jgi:hypothetical protein
MFNAYSAGSSPTAPPFALSLSKDPVLSLSKEPVLSLSKEPVLSLSKGFDKLSPNGGRALVKLLLSSGYWRASSNPHVYRSR